MLAGWLVLAATGLPLAKALRDEGTHSSTNELRYLLIQPNLPRPQRWDPESQASALESTARQVDQALREAPSAHPDLIVWPENLITTPVDGPRGLQREIETFVTSWRAPLVAGVVRTPLGRVPETYRSSILWFDPKEGVVAALDKQRAVPLLESSRTPATLQWIRATLGRAATWPKVEEIATSAPLRGDFSLAAGLCYEVLFPRIVASRREADTVAILNLADDSWVEGDQATHQLVEYARFRAIEQRLPLIRVAHGGLSIVIDEFGETLTALPTDVAASEMVSVRPSAHASASERISIAALPVATGLVIGWLWSLCPGRGASRQIDRR
jgi:apolipoprotein N-acyltransferase